MYDEFFAKAHELIEKGEPFATATVVRAEKPTSGKPGDKAIVTRDGVMLGWIGGSCAQPTVIAQALAVIAEDRTRLVRITPEPDREAPPDGVEEVEMTCFSGGTIDVERGGAVYYFCCGGCLAKFPSQPERYAAVLAHETA